MNPPPVLMRGNLKSDNYSFALKVPLQVPVDNVQWPPITLEKCTEAQFWMRHRVRMFSVPAFHSGGRGSIPLS